MDAEQPEGRKRPPSPEPERYEPLPGLAALPRWLWRKMGRLSRVALVGALLAIAALAVALAPGIREAKEEHAESQRREQAEQRARLIRELEADQRAGRRRSASVAPAGARAEARLAARVGLMEELAAEVLADARRRVRAGRLDGPIRRVECEPFPRTVAGIGADEDLSRRRGRYSCVAVTSELEASEETVGVVIGHPYFVLVDFETGRYGFCKSAGRAGEGGATRAPLASLPRACGGP